MRIAQLSDESGEKFPENIFKAFCSHVACRSQREIYLDLPLRPDFAMLSLNALV